MSVAQQIQARPEVGHDFLGGTRLLNPVVQTLYRRNRSYEGVWMAGASVLINALVPSGAGAPGRRTLHHSVRPGREAARYEPSWLTAMGDQSTPGKGPA